MKCLAALAASIAFGQTCPELIEAARAAYAAKQYLQAAGGLERALQVCPPNVPIFLDLARAHFMAQQFEQAKAALARLIASEPRNAAALKLQGDTLYLLGEHIEAEKSLLTAAGLEPTNPEPHYTLGRIYYQQSRYDDAVEHLRKVLAIDAKSYRAYDNLGLAYQGLNDVPKALANYQRAIELSTNADPPYDWVYGNLSNLWHKSGDYTQAFQFGAEAAHRNPNSARNFFLTGRALAKLEKWELAAKWLKQSVALDPKYSEARYQFAQVLRKLGRPDEADAQLAAFRELTAGQTRNRR